MSLDYYGMHGTCRTFADKIVSNGFNQGVGRHGTGVYFWESSLESYLRNHSIRLSQYFAQDMKAKGYYKAANDDTPTVLSTQLTLTDSNQFLDLEEYEINAMFKAFMLKSTDYLNSAKNTSDAKRKSSIVFQKFIEIVEKCKSVKINMIRVKTSAPQSFRNNLNEIQFNCGMDKQPCYVVRDNKIICNITKV
jgi:hypothetical protein